MFALVSAALLGFLLETLGRHYQSLSLYSERNGGKIALGAFVLVSLCVLVLGTNPEIRAYHDVVISALAGFFFGYLASLWGRPRHVSVHRTFVMSAILIVGLVPNVGKEIRNFMVDVGIEELKTPYFSLRLPSTKFAPPLFDNGKSHSTLPKPGFEFFQKVSETLSGRMEFDQSILRLLTNEDLIPQKEHEEVFGGTITPLLLCVKDVRSHFRHQFEAGKIAEPLALGFSRLLSSNTSNIEHESERLHEVFTNIIDELGKLRRDSQGSSPGDRNNVDPGDNNQKKPDLCSTTGENEQSFPDSGALKELVEQYPSHPYAAITLAALFQLAGSYEASEEVIEDWIEEHKKAEFDGLTELVKRVNLVRAYSYLDLLESSRRTEHMLQVKIGYIEALEVLSEEMRRKGRLDVTNDCEKLDDDVLRRFVLAGVLARNNFADEVSSAGKEAHERYGRMALRYVEEVRQFDVMKCQPKRWPSDLGRYLGAAFLDTLAKVVYWDARHDREKQGEFNRLVREAERAWRQALIRLKRIVHVEYRVTGDKLRDTIEAQLLQIRRTRNSQ